MSTIALADSLTDNALGEAVESSENSYATRELRVLQIFDGLGMGGAETWLMSLLKYFQEQNEHADLRVRFDVLLTGGERTVFDDEAVALGARLFYLPFTRRTMRSFANEFRRILAEGNYDAVHDHQDYIAGFHFLAGAGHLPPVRIAHVHNPFYHREPSETGFSKRTINRLGKYLVGRYATHVTGTSRQILTEYGFDELSGRVSLGAVHCGFDVSRYEGDHQATRAELCNEFGWEDNAKILLFVGRLDGAEFVYNGRRMTHKNPAFALEIGRECIKRDERMKLLMVGSGEEKQREFEARVAAWGLSKSITFAGSRSDVPRLMTGSDLLLFPSVAEGLGMVVVEAQAAGLPVLASDTIPRECVVQSQLVQFHSLESDPAGWSEHALQLMTARSDGRKTNELVRQSNFSIENSAKQLTSLYAGVLKA